MKDIENGTSRKAKIHDVEELVHRAARWQWTALMFIFLSIGLLSLLLSVWFTKDLRHFPAMPCPQTNGFPNSDSLDTPIEDSVFAQLTAPEIEAVLSYLYNDKSLELHPPNTAAIDKNFIHTIELKSPPKQEVLRFLEKKRHKPAREAKVYIFLGKSSPPFIAEYVVGPLPNITYSLVYKTSARKTKIPYHLRPFSSFEFMAIYEYILPNVSERAHHVLLESYDATPIKPECGDKCLRFSMTPISSGFLPEGSRKAWFWFAYDSGFFTLNPLDFQFLVEMTSSNPKEWKIEEVWYSGQLFHSFDEFLRQYEIGKIRKTRLNFPDHEGKLFSSLEFRGSDKVFEPKVAPLLFEPDGARYKVLGNEVTYMDWKLHYRMSVTGGLQLFNILYDNERIAYELSMQEVSVLYSGHNPAARMLYYTDSAALFGTRCRGLLPGIDCPAHAKYMNTYLYAANEMGSKTFENAFCIFEHNSNLPLRRHRAYGRSGAFYGGLPTTVLIVRTIISVVNYDYVFDYIFYNNGAIEVKVALTGYLGTTFYFPEEDPYGARVNEYVSAGIHNHLFHFKADVDVKGTENRFETLEIRLENKTDPWQGDPRKKHIQTNVRRVLKKTEKEAACKYKFSKPKYLLMSNSKEKTKAGLTRSYRLLPRGMSKNLLPQDYGFERSVSWGRYQVAITAQKDDEEMSSSMFAMWDAREPVVDFQSYIDDDDDIVDKDLVAWITLGTQHIPQMENTPNTGTVGTQLSFFLLPYNYFDEDPSMHSSDSVFITPKDKERPLEGANVERKQKPREINCVPSFPIPDEFLRHNSTFLFS